MPNLTNILTDEEKEEAGGKWEDLMSKYSGLSRPVTKLPRCGLMMG